MFLWFCLISGLGSRTGGPLGPLGPLGPRPESRVLPFARICRTDTQVQGMEEEQRVTSRRKRKELESLPCGNPTFELPLDETFQYTSNSGVYSPLTRFGDWSPMVADNGQRKRHEHEPLCRSNGGALRQRQGGVHIPSSRCRRWWLQTFFLRCSPYA